MGFSAGAAFSFEAFDRVFDGVAGSGGATETSAGGAEREVPQPIPLFNAILLITHGLQKEGRGSNIQWPVLE